MKKIISFILVILTVFAVSVPAYATRNKITFYSFYNDNMLFEQNKKAVIAGNATYGTTIKAVLKNSLSKTVSEGQSKANSNGKFEVGFDAPKGSFDEYTVDIYQDNVLVKTFIGIVFGELWLASGQSNMNYNLNASSEWNEMVKSGNYGNKWVRFLQVPVYLTFNGSTEVPYDKQENIEGAYWIRSDKADVGVISAVGYYFAYKLYENLKMPIGILSASVGGSTIRAWISRDTLENDTVIMKRLKEKDKYLNEKNWVTDENAYVSSMTADYNTKIYPLRRFNISGLVWYQGESEIFEQWEYKDYTRFVDLLQEDYTKTFNYTEGKLPFVYTQLAPYDYVDGGLHLQGFNANLAEIQKQDPSSRAMTCISDISLEYLKSSGSIHPMTKKPVGERLGQAASGLVYSQSKTYTAASIKSSYIKGSDIFVTLNNVGDGLRCKGEVLYDFAICGEDGIYYKADAEIVSDDTVKIHNDKIKMPKSATYSFSQNNCRANLYSTLNGELFMPASPFVTDEKYNTFFYYEMPWTDCEQKQYWRMVNEDLMTGFYDIWDCSNASYFISKGSAYKGSAGLKVNSSEKNFSFYQIYRIKIGDDSVKFKETTRDFSKYGSLSFKIRNTGENEITLNSANIYLNEKMWFSPAVSGTNSTEFTVPADGKWHTVELDLSRIYLFGNVDTVELNGKIFLNDISKFKLDFSSNGEANFDMDDFEFSYDTNVSHKTNMKFISIILNTIYLGIKGFIFSYLFKI